ncbi:MAG TPA: UDP-N-acetylmuramoyl-L-alanyl-D-glutamate--2,6-diaminopimelate ligase, partial [Rhodanobacteraceae bacterium]|nr:UDP-N-acetylmuramoyl-L-alanyl-D-glutamate--2,6-diaminopimelate ligase [Rhodanobacteraceae bacterium]
MTTSMPLRDLLGDLARPRLAADIRVTGLNLDSRRIRPGDAFVALQGGRTHGIEFAPAALERGAVAVLAEAPPPATSTAACAGPVVWIDGLRRHLGDIAARFHGDPSAALKVIGVTGTNGKTSTVQLLAQALQRLGHASASIGTLGAGMVGALAPGERTTPDVITLHALLAGMREAGATHVAMEVSSHALDQHRVDGVAFTLAVFTNLTRDHLDYHGTMHAYGEAKARLFAWPTLDAAILNIDDAFGRQLVTRLADGVACLRTSASGNTAAEVRALDVRTPASGLAFRLATPWGDAGITSPLLGRFNVANLLAVAACLGALGEPFARIVDVLPSLQPVRGRMNRLGGHGGLPLLVVDYAHTPDALEQALGNLREHCHGRLLCVFGCGGERDTGKRPQMGAIAERLADALIVTDDNPRGEDGDAIVAGILAGLAQPARACVERDRARAIAAALAMARADDVILVAGKG